MGYDVINPNSLRKKWVSLMTKVCTALSHQLKSGEVIEFSTAPTQLPTRKLKGAVEEEFDKIEIHKLGQQVLINLYYDREADYDVSVGFDEEFGLTIMADDITSYIAPDDMVAFQWLYSKFVKNASKANLDSEEDTEEKPQPEDEESGEPGEEEKKDTDEVSPDSNGDSDSQIHGGSHASSEVKDSPNHSKDGENSGPSSSESESDSDFDELSEICEDSTGSDSESSFEFEIKEEDDSSDQKQKREPRRRRGRGNPNSDSSKEESKDEDASSKPAKPSKALRAAFKFNDKELELALKDGNLKYMPYNMADKLSSKAKDAAELKALLKEFFRLAASEDPYVGRSVSEEDIERAAEAYASVTSIARRDLNEAVSFKGTKFDAASTIAYGKGLVKKEYNEKEATRVFENLITMASNGKDVSPRLDNKKLAKALLSYKNPYNSRKSEMDKEAVMLMVDTSASLHGFEGFVYVAAKLSEIYDNIIVVLTSNNMPWAVIRNGKANGTLYTPNTELASGIIEKIMRDHNVKYLINVNDFDGLDIIQNLYDGYCKKASVKVLHINNFRSSYGNIVKATTAETRQAGFKNKDVAYYYGVNPKAMITVIRMWTKKL